MSIWDDCDTVPFRYGVHYFQHLQRLAYSGGKSCTVGFDAQGRYASVRNGISKRQQSERFDDDQTMLDAANVDWLVAWERSNDR